MASLSSLELKVVNGKLIEQNGSHYQGELYVKLDRKHFPAFFEQNFPYTIKHDYPPFWRTRPALVTILSSEIPSVPLPDGIWFYKPDGGEPHSSLVAECSDYMPYQRKKDVTSFANEQMVGNYLLSGELVLINEIVNSFLQSGRKENLNILLTGLPGSGKSSFAYFLKDQYGLEFASTNIPDAHESSDLFYYRGFTKEGDFLRKSELAKLLEAETNSPCLVLLDELNRGQVGVVNSIFSMLDFQRKMNLLNEVVTIKRPVVFVATANIGSKFAVGQIDSALVQRFNIVVNMQPLGKEAYIKIGQETCKKLNLNLSQERLEMLAELMVSCSQILVEEELLDFTEVSPRTLNNVLNLMSYGVNFSNAVLIGLVNHQITNENRQMILDLPHFRRIANLKE